MTLEVRFTVPPEVIHQTIDEEVILVHLSRGTYHSLRGSGGLLFEALASGASVRELAAILALQTDGSASAIDAAVARFVQALVGEELVRSRTAADGDAAAQAVALTPGPALAKRPFEEPSLETFTDLKFLLNADPVHDVEASGWPVMAGEGHRRP